MQPQQNKWDGSGPSTGAAPSTSSGRSLFDQAQAGCRESLNRLAEIHDGLVHAVVRRQVLGDLPYIEALQAGREGLWCQETLQQPWGDSAGYFGAPVSDCDTGARTMSREQGAGAVNGFFTVGQSNGRWWFVAPDGRPFWSIGMNHIDSAALRFKESSGVWEREHDAGHYRRVMDALWGIPQCVGYHLCGAHIRNNARRYGFRDRTNAAILDTVDGIRAVNFEIQKRINP